MILMKFGILAAFCLLRITCISCVNMLDCALGRLAENQCPQDGGWNLWTAWGPCEGECGSVGRQLRFRNCSNPLPARNGVDCDGDQREVNQCILPGCTYEQYEKLLSQDAVRLQQLSRLKELSGSQSALLTKCVSSSCDLSDIDKALSASQTQFWNALQCVKKNTGCPAPGGWGDWSPWSRCSARCGTGQQMRCRACCDPPPSSSDVTCYGDTCEYQPCAGMDCGQPLSRGGEWSQWTEWSDCSYPCNFGLTRRSRICQKETPSSNEENAPSFNSADDYSNNGEYVDTEENNNDAYDDDDGDQTVNDYNEKNYDDFDDDTDSSWKVAKRSHSCDKIEYYNNDEEEDILSTTISNLRRTTRKTEKNITGQLKNSKKLTDKGRDSWIFNHTEVLRSGTKLKTEATNLVSSRVSEPVTVKSEMGSENRFKKTTVKPFNLFSVKLPNGSKNLFAKNNILRSGKDKLTPISKNTPKTKNSKEDNPILLDDSEDDSECTGELYKNPAKAKISKYTTELLETVRKSSKNHFPSSALTSVQHLKSSTSDATPNTIISSETDQENIPPSTVTEALTSVQHLKSSMSNAAPNTRISSETDQEKIPPSTVTERETLGTPSTNTETESLSQQTPSFFPTSLPNLFSKLSVASTQKASTQKAVEIIPTETSPVTNIYGISEVNGAPREILDLNVSTSIGHPISCDLKKKLELPSSNDSFLAEGCSGPFEEIKPCNIQLCNEDGGWSDWSSWSGCTPGCGLGTQVSVRSCTNPEPRSSGTYCSGEAVWRRTCYLQPCPVSLKTAKAVFLKGDSVVKYDSMQQLSSVLLLYVRFRHFSPTGNIVARRPHNCQRNQTCNHVTLSLYRSHVLVSVLRQNCHINFLTSQRLSVGDWHEALLTIVGAVVTLQLDDSVLTQTYNLTCRPSSPNYDSDMIIGGAGFVGEVDRLIINFKNYVFKKKIEKRDSSRWNEDTIAPVDSTQMHFEVNNKDVPTVSLAHLLQAPCFTNRSSWNLELAIKPKFPDGLVIFIKGYDSRDFLFVSLEQTRVKLRVRAAAQAGECEHPGLVAPQTWLHLGLSRPPGGPVGLSVDGGPRCVVNLAPPSNDTEEPVVYCRGGILLGEMPLSVKKVLSSEPPHVQPFHSTLGLLGYLSIDNHTLDLSRLPRKITPDLAGTYPPENYRLSSHTAATTVFYEEMLVMKGEQLSMSCMYDLSPENVTNTNPDVELDLNWYKLDIPVSTVFSNDSDISYEIITTGKATTLKVSNYSTVEKVEGFYSCWLHYPFPLQSGLNIVTYGVIVISSSQDKRTWLYYVIMAHLCFIIILLIILALCLVYEAYQDSKQRSGFYRCKKLKGEEALKALQIYIFSNKAINRLGGIEVAETAYDRYKEFLVHEARVQALRENKDTGLTTDMTSDNEVSSEEEKRRQRNKGKRNGKSSGDVGVTDPPSRKSTAYYSVTSEHIEIPENFAPRNYTVGFTDGKLHSPFSKSMDIVRSISESRITIEDLQQTDPEEEESADDNLIDVSEKWMAKDIGKIKKTVAYRSIKNELKFKPEKFKALTKNNVYNRYNKNDK